MVDVEASELAGGDHVDARELLGADGDQDGVVQGGSRRIRGEPRRNRIAADDGREKLGFLAHGEHDSEESRIQNRESGVERGMNQSSFFSLTLRNSSPEPWFCRPM